MTETMTSEDFLSRQGQGKPKDPDRVIKGMMSQRDGKNFEKFIDQANEIYELLGIARIEKLPVATQPMPKTWIAKAHQMKSGISRILSERAPFDYYGTLGKAGPKGDELRWRGRAVAMECKYTKKTHRLGVGKSGTLKEHQLAACATAWSKFGTIAVIVWNNGGERGVLLPDKVVDVYQRYRIGARGSKGIPWDLFTPYPVRSVDEGPSFEDWLAPAISFMKLHLEKADADARRHHQGTGGD